MESRIPRVVLVLAADPVVGALLGVLIELAGEAPWYPEPAEAPVDAIARVRAPLICLDCNHDLACEDEAYEAADRVGSAILLFGHHGDRARMERMVQERDAHVLALPMAPAALGRLLDEALAA